MLDFTWRVFSSTGNIDTYLLFKEIQKENMETPDDSQDEELKDFNLPVS
ncbi:YqzL family protein [Bacillus songklensis]|uniref:YqzL family protein n=1 Tax=Bacillus songklensis TaxID=1069116 RepID=A0ABV8B1C0_9BACI